MSILLSKQTGPMLELLIQLCKFAINTEPQYVTIILMVIPQALYGLLNSKFSLVWFSLVCSTHLVTTCDSGYVKFSYFIYSVVCLTTGPKPLPKRFLHIVRSKASSFK